MKPFQEKDYYPQMECKCEGEDLNLDGRSVIGGVSQFELLHNGSCICKSSDGFKYTPDENIPLGEKQVLAKGVKVKNIDFGNKILSPDEIIDRTKFHFNQSEFTCVNVGGIESQEISAKRDKIEADIQGEFLCKTIYQDKFYLGNLRIHSDI